MEENSSLRHQMVLSFFLIFNLRSTCLAGYCTMSSQCQRNCYRVQHTNTHCGIFGWGWSTCTEYRLAVFSCTSLCYKRECCPGYEGPRCDTPLCYGSTTCPNGGTCQSPDLCLCPNGFEGNLCSDIDECSLGISGCQQQCQNTPGSYQCSCNEGYVLANNSHSCQDRNECGDNKGGCDQICINVKGSHRCECHGGYELDADQQTCMDVDECSRNISECDDLCNNTLGSFVCSCRPGYVLGNDGKSCNGTETTEQNQDDKTGLTTYGIIGIVVATIVCFFVVVLAIMSCIRYKNCRNTRESYTSGHLDNIANEMDNSDTQEPPTFNLSDECSM